MITVLLGLLKAIIYCGIVNPLPIMLGKAQVSLLGQARQHTQHIGQGHSHDTKVWSSSRLNNFFLKRTHVQKNCFGVTITNVMMITGNIMQS